MPTTEPERGDLGRRTFRSLGWQFGSRPFLIALLFLRSVVLARLLPVEVFGVYALGAAIVGLTTLSSGLGMSAGLLTRVEETADEDRATAVLLVLRLAFAALGFALVLAGALLWAEPDLRLVLIVSGLVMIGNVIVDTTRRLLVRRVAHRRLVLANGLAVLVATCAALLVAQRSPTVWPLLTAEIVTMAVTMLVLLAWRPPWRLHLAWDPHIARYFLHFGRRTFPSLLLERGSDRIDDLWTGFALGDFALGVYSRAYRFATYPRQLIAAPINSVFFGTYAEVARDRQRLSMAFFRSNALLVRGACLLMGGLGVAAPELIRLVLTEKWMPMLTPFRLLLVFSLLDPLAMGLSGLLMSTGRPERVFLPRLVQVLVLVLGLLTLGRAYGTSGVALSVDLMALAGVALLFREARRIVDVSLLALWGPPLAAMAAGLLAVALLLRLPPPPGADLGMLAAKSAAFGLVFVAVLLVVERRRLRLLLDYARALRSGPARSRA